MANRTISENINQAISDFKGIKQAIIDRGIEIPEGTPTSEYGAKIEEIKGIVDTTDLKKLIERTTATPNLPNDLTKIGEYAFYRYTNLALTELPSGLTSIGSNAFYSCTGLTTITFKGKPKTIASNAFRGCTNLTEIRVPWASGEVANAPWGAKNASILYSQQV